MDKKDGPLIGKTTFIEPSDDDVFTENRPPDPVMVSLMQMEGFHEIYFVFKNEKTKGAIFVPVSATFIPE